MSAAAAPINNRLFILILQHPQEKKEALGTAALTVAALRKSVLVVGLSWPNLSQALGHSADPKRWAVLYLGSVRPAALGSGREIVAIDRRGVAIPGQAESIRDLDGVVLLDGSWSQAKVLWWRNPWLLKLHRLVLDPPHRSRYRVLRRAARREALSTIETAGLLLRHLDGGIEMERALLAELDRIVAEADPGPARRR